MALQAVTYFMSDGALLRQRGMNRPESWGRFGWRSLQINLATDAVQIRPAQAHQRFPDAFLHTVKS